MGRIGAGMASFALGNAAPTALANASWSQRVAQLHELLDGGVAAYQSTRNILEGRATPFDILPFVPLIGYVVSTAAPAIARAIRPGSFNPTRPARVGSGIGLIPDDNNGIPIKRSGRPFVAAEYATDCGPASCAMVLETHGIKDYGDLDDLARQAGVVRPGPGVQGQGSKLDDLAELLRQKGLNTARWQSDVTLKRLGEVVSSENPAIAAVDIGSHNAHGFSGGHAVVVDAITTITEDGVNKTILSIRDPARGEYFYPAEAFLAYFTGEAIFTNPNPLADQLNNLFRL